MRCARYCDEVFVILWFVDLKRSKPYLIMRMRKDEEIERREKQGRSWVVKLPMSCIVLYAWQICIILI